MSELSRIYGIDFLFEGQENVTELIERINKSVKKLDDNLTQSGTDIDNALKKAEAGLSDFSQKLNEAREASDKFLSASPQDRDTFFSEAVAKVKEAAKAYEDEIKNLEELKQKIGDAGGNTRKIDNSIKQLKLDYEELGKTMDSLASNRVMELAEAFLNAEEEADKSKIKLQAVNEIVQVLGKSADEAETYFDALADGLKDSGGSFKEYIEEVAKSTNLTSGLQKAAKGLIKSLVGKVGLSGAAATAAAAVGGALAAAGIAVLIPKITALVKKGKDAVIEWATGWSKLRDAMREGVGSATVSAAEELNRLDELNAKLSSATRNSAEYNNTKKEILSLYGQYNQHLDDEINRVGNLSTVYDQLRGAIIEAALAKEREKLVSETYDKYGEGLSEASAKMLKRYQRKFGSERGYEAFKSWQQSMLTGSEMSEDAAKGEGWSASRAFQRRSRRLNQKVNAITSTMTSSTTDNTFDYTASNQLYDEALQRAELIRKAKQAEADIVRDQDQLTIDAMRDGFAKQYKQAELNYQRRLDQMDDFKEAFIQRRLAMVEAEWSENNYGAELDKNGIFYQGAVRKAKKDANDAWAKQEELERQAYQAQMAEIAFQQRQSLISSYGTLDQQKQGARERWRREEITSEFRNRANAIHEYEFAQMDYEAIQKYGNQDQIREALEKMLDAEIKTLEDAEKPAAEARKKVTLAEFDADLAEKYAGRAEQRKALEAKLDAELQTIDEKYREIQAASNKVTLAEFDQATADQYGTRSQRRNALENTLAARLEEFVKKNGEAQRAIIEAQNEYELANFDYEEVVDYGSYDQVLATLRNKWQKFIATLPEDLRAGATKKMNAEIYDLERQHSGVYQQIFSDMDNMTRTAIDKTISLAEEELQHLIETGDVSVDVISELSNRIDTLRQKRDELDFGGWGGSISGVLGLNAERERNRQRRGRIVNAMTEMWDRQGAEANLTDEYKELERQLEATDVAEEKLTEDIKKQAAVIAASGVADALSQIGSLLNDIAQVSGNENLAQFGQDMAEFGSALSNVANGFAQGGIVGGIVAAAKETVNAVVEVVRSVTQGAAQWDKTMAGFTKTVENLKYTLDSTNFENVFGSDAAGYARDAYSKAALALQDYRKASDELKNSMFKTQEDVKNPWWLKASPLTATWSWYQTFFGKNKHQSSFNDLDIWGDDGYLDVDKAQAFLDTQTTLTEEQVKQIQNAIALKEAYDDATAAVESYVASFVGSTVSDLAGEMLENFLETGDAVMDLTDNMDSFAQAIAKSAIESRLLNEVFTDDMQQKMVDLIVSGNNNGAIDLYNQLLEQANSLAPSINDFLSGIGIKQRDDDSADSRSASRRSSLGASQDSIDESNGRLTAIQGHTYSMMANVDLIRMQNEELRLRTTELLAEVMGIHEDTSNMGTVLEEMSGYVREVKSSVNLILDKGITVQ